LLRENQHLAISSSQLANPKTNPSLSKGAVLVLPVRFKKTWSEVATSLPFHVSPFRIIRKLVAELVAAAILIATSENQHLAVSSGVPGHKLRCTGGSTCEACLAPGPQKKSWPNSSSPPKSLNPRDLSWFVRRGRKLNSAPGKPAHSVLAFGSAITRPDPGDVLLRCYEKTST